MSSIVPSRMGESLRRLLLCGLPSLGACSTPPSFAPSRPVEGPSTAPSLTALRPDASLAAVMQFALDHSPRVHAARARAEAASFGPAIAGALPDPTLTLGWYAEEVETRVGPQRWSLAIQQRIPWPAELRAEADRKGHEARMARAELEAVRQDVLRDVVITWHERAYLAQAQRITRRIQTVMEGFRAEALAEREEGSATVSEVLRAESQLAQLEHDAVILSELARAEDERLRALLALPQGGALPPPVPVGPPTLGSTMPDLDEVLRWNPELRRARWREEAAAAGLELARSQRFPDLLLGGTYIATDRRRDLVSGAARPAGDGDDPILLQLGLALPVWGRQRAEQRAARAQELAARMDASALREHVRAELSAAWWRASSAERLTRLYESTLLPQAEAAAQAAQTLFDGGQGSFAGLLETVAAWHAFELGQARARADHGIAIARLERWLGRPLSVQVATPEADA